MDQGHTLWKSDGTLEGTVQVAALDGAGYELERTAVVGGTLYFITTQSSITGSPSPYVLWKSDGSTTERLKEFPRSNTPAPGFLTASGGAAYFWAFDAAHGYELWKSDGTEAGTGMLTDLNPGPPGAVGTPGPLVALGPDEPLMFSASDGVSGMELWQTDRTVEVVDANQDARLGRAAPPLTMLDYFEDTPLEGP